MEPEYKMEEEPTCFYLISSMNPSMAASHCLSQSPFKTSVFPQFAKFTSKPTLKSVLDTLPLPYNFKPTQCKLNLREVLSQNPAEAITTSVPKTQKFQHCFTKSDDGYLYCDDLRVQDVMETGERRPFYAVLVLLGSGNELLFASTAKRSFRNGDRKTLDDLVLAGTGGVFVDLERVSDFDSRVSAVRIAEKKINYPQLGTMGPFLYTSESVTEGHPDKLCDQIADTILDGCLELDPDSKVGCKACIKNNKFMVIGEVTTKARVDYEKIVRDTCRDVGYVSEEIGLDANHCEVLVNIEQQSPDVAQGVHSHPTIAQGVLVFGYATDETPEMMPLGQVVANKATASMDRFRKKGTYPWLGPAGKVRVTCEYSDVNGAMVPVRVLTVDIITQHDGTVTKDEINAAEFMEHVIKPVIPEKYLDEKTNFHLILSNQFVPGGPCGHAGHTGRQIMADKYGGLVPLFGGDFSGKDPSKVERCGAYIARQAAKSIVANGLARRCIVYLLYAIGEPEPLSVIVDTYGTGKILNKEISKIMKKNFDFRPGMIAINLDLKRCGNGRFSKTAVYGHFGRDDPDFTWEVVKNLN